MSDRVVQSYCGSDGMTGKAVHSYQSVWMAHWMRTNCKSANQGCSQLSICYESQEENHDASASQHHFLSGSEIVNNSSKYTKRFNEVTKAKAVSIINENMISSSERLRSDGLDCQPFPFRLPQNRESIVAENNEQASISHVRSQIDLDSRYYPFRLNRGDRNSNSMRARSLSDLETSSRECYFPRKQSERYDEFIESKRKSIGDSNGRIPLQSMCRHEETSKRIPILASEDQATNYCSNSMFLVHEKTTNISGRSTNSLLRHDDVSLPHDISKSIYQPNFLGTQCQRIQDCSGIGLLPSQSISPGLHSSKPLYLGCSSLPSLPGGVYNLEDLRICSAVNSMEDSARVPAKFSQTTHHFMLAKENNFDLFEGGPLSAKLKGKTVPELFSLCPDNGLPVQHGVKLQLLGGSPSSEGQKDVKASAENLNNESSADTDTMDMDIFRQNCVSGMASSPTNKCIELDQQSPTSQLVFPSTEEENRESLVKSNLPDINHELPDLAASVDDRETSTSRTQSLDVEHLLSHAVEPINFKSTACSESYLEQATGNRWVKRLKLNTNTAHGTKSSEMAESSSHEKVNKFFSKILKCRSSSEPTTGRCRGKEQKVLDQTAFILRNSESSSIESKRENQDTKILHTWIRRWCHNAAVSPSKKSKAVEFGEPQVSKAVLDEVHQKHFPSLAAMALMGKAMTRCNPCEFTKKGGTVVWNSK